MQLLANPRGWHFSCAALRKRLKGTIIPIKRKKPGDPEPPRPLRSNQYPNGLPFLSFVDRMKISKANRLYHLTAKLIQWAVGNRLPLLCRESTIQFLLANQFYSSGHWTHEFYSFPVLPVRKYPTEAHHAWFQCWRVPMHQQNVRWVSTSHRHETMGADSLNKSICDGDGDSLSHEVSQDDSLTICAGVAETRHFQCPQRPLRRFRNLTHHFCLPWGLRLAYKRKHHDCHHWSQRMQPRWHWTAFKSDLPQFEVGHKVSGILNVETYNAATSLPKGSKLLFTTNALLPSKCLQGGVFVSGQQLQQCEVDKIVDLCGNSPIQKTGVTETQVWGVPWSEQQFVEQMVLFGHPMNLQSNLPEALRDTLEIYNSMDAQQRMAYRANKLGFWLKRLLELKNQENTLKQSLDPEVAQVLQTKNILLWKDMLESTQYSDMEVVSEFMSGSMLVGCVERTGLWPAKFQPAAIGVEELHQVATKEPHSFSATFWTRKPGATTWTKYGQRPWMRSKLEHWWGPLTWVRYLTVIPLSGDSEFCKVQNYVALMITPVPASTVQCRPVRARSLTRWTCMQPFVFLVMSSCGHTNNKWRGRTFDLTGAYRQCAVHPESRPYAPHRCQTSLHRRHQSVQDAGAPIRSSEISAFIPESNQPVYGSCW